MKQLARAPRRQQVIGPYIADFINFDAMLVIEVGGGQHVSAEEKDKARPEYLKGTSINSESASLIPG